MKYIYKTLSILGVTLLAAGCAQPAVSSSSAPQETEETKVQEDDIYIFFTSDTHCSVDENLGFPAAKAVVDDTKAEHPYVSLVDLGDYIQGGTIGSLTFGMLPVTLMNDMNYDIATLGNHEFDYGMPQLKTLMGKMNFDLTVCNITYTGKNEDIFKDIPKYVMKEYGNTKVAFIGITTPGSITSSTPDNFQEDGEFVYDFGAGNGGKRLAGIVQKTVDEAREAGADYVVALSHLGATEEDGENNSINLIHNTTGIDAVLDGHAHIVISGTEYPNAEGKDVLLASVGTKMQNLGELIISPDGTFSSLLISEYNRQDEEIAAKITEAHDKISAVLGEKVCDLAFDMPITDEEGIRIVRTRETGLADLIADSMRSQNGTDIAFVNGGGVRHALSAGEITMESLFEVLPFQNTIGVCRVSGQQVIDLLEIASAYTESITSFDGAPVGESGGFLIPSGLRYTINTSVPSGVQRDENGMATGIEGERRVTDITVLKDGEWVPIDPEAEYTVSSSSYILFSNGDGNTAFSGAEVIIKEGKDDFNTLIDYIKASGGISETYQTTDGRITVK